MFHVLTSQDDKENKLLKNVSVRAVQCPHFFSRHKLRKLSVKNKAKERVILSPVSTKTLVLEIQRRKEA